ncbi:MAG TPA: hypothetical protein DEO95_01730, partial [Ruminococcaceae bacterium]|nr:hypothetical protein [Oscillospiraceae bacterium]
MFTIPKSWSLNGLQSFEIPDLQSADIFGNQYHYYVKEVTSTGTQIDNSNVRTVDSPFRDNSGTTADPVVGELLKLHFRLQRKTSAENAAYEPFTESLTVDGKTYTADNGVYTVTKQYVGSGTDATIKDIVIKGLPKRTDGENPLAYTYSLEECNYDGSAAVIANTDKVTVKQADDTDSTIKLTVAKPFNSTGKTTVLVTKELPKLYFKIQRKIDPQAEFQTVFRNVDGARLTLTVNGETYQADSNGVFAVPKTYIDTHNGNNTVTTLSPFVIAGLPEKTEEDKPTTERRTYTYQVQECNADGTDLTVSDMTFTQAADGTDKINLTVTKPLGDEDPNTYYQLYRRLKGKDY